MALSAVIILERIHTFDEPLERDITTYALVGDGLLHGRALYSDLWDHKPPLLYLIFAAAESLVGYGPSAPFLLNIIFTVATLVAVFMACRKGRNPMAGVWGALFWTAANGDLYLQANQPNTEVFVNAFLTWSFVGWRSLKGPSKDWIPFLLGLLSLAASFCKQLAILGPLAMGAAYGWQNLDRKTPGTSRKLIVVASVLVLGWSLLAAYFTVTGRSKDFNYAIFTYNLEYSRQSLTGLWNYLGPQTLKKINLSFIGFLFPLGVLSLWGLARRWGKERYDWAIWAAFLVATLLQIVWTWHFQPHYYQLLLPPMVIGAAWGADDLGNYLKEKFRSLSSLPGVLLLACLLIHEVPFYFWPGPAWSILKYGTIFYETEQWGTQIGEWLLPGETLYEWGNETGLYFYSHREPACGLFYNYPFSTLTGSRQMMERVLRDLDRHPPELFVLPKDSDIPGDKNPLIEWFRPRYRPFPGKHEGRFLFFIRKGGELEKRVRDTGP